jgi:hypothetical protein
MMWNAAFNNISVISWWSVLMVEETGVPGETTDLYRLLLNGLRNYSKLKSTSEV